MEQERDDEVATVDVQFTDLPNALVACKVSDEIFSTQCLKVSTCQHVTLHVYLIHILHFPHGGRHKS